MSLKVLSFFIYQQQFDLFLLNPSAEVRLIQIFTLPAYLFIRAAAFQLTLSGRYWGLQSNVYCHNKLKNAVVFYHNISVRLFIRDNQESVSFCIYALDILQTAANCED